MGGKGYLAASALLGGTFNWSRGYTANEALDVIEPQGYRYLVEFHIPRGFPGCLPYELLGDLVDRLDEGGHEFNRDWTMVAGSRRERDYPADTWHTTFAFMTEVDAVLCKIIMSDFT